MANAKHDCRSYHKERQPNRTGVAGKQQSQQREESADTVEYEGRPLLRPTSLQQHVMDMLAVALKQRLATDEPPGNRDSRIDYRQTEGDDWNGDGHGSRCLLRTLNRQGGEHEADKQRTRITEEDRRRMKVVSQESHQRA